MMLCNLGVRNTLFPGAQGPEMQDDSRTREFPPLDLNSARTSNALMPQLTPLRMTLLVDWTEDLKRTLPLR